MTWTPISPGAAVAALIESRPRDVGMHLLRTAEEIMRRIEDGLGRGVRSFAITAAAAEILDIDRIPSCISRTPDQEARFAASRLFGIDGNVGTLEEHLGEMPGVEALIVAFRTVGWSVRAISDRETMLPKGHPYGPGLRYQHRPFAVVLRFSV